MGSGKKQGDRSKTKYRVDTKPDQIRLSALQATEKSSGYSKCSGKEELTKLSPGRAVGRCDFSSLSSIL